MSLTNEQIYECELAKLRIACNAQMLLVKACEHIAVGDEGWQKLRNECPSTAAVAGLRDAFEESEREFKLLRERSVRG